MIPAKQIAALAFLVNILIANGQNVQPAVVVNDTNMYSGRIIIKERVYIFCRY